MGFGVGAGDGGGCDAMAAMVSSSERRGISSGTPDLVVNDKPQNLDIKAKVSADKCARPRHKKRWAYLLGSGLPFFLIKEKLFLMSASNGA
eukprot:3340266-Rhodomonas_salina.2